MSSLIFLFEFENVDFNAPDYEVFLDFPDGFETLSSDVALVYFLWDVVEIDGSDFEVWRQLPQSVLTQDGTLQYNFDFSMKDECPWRPPGKTTLRGPARSLPAERC